MTDAAPETGEDRIGAQRRADVAGSVSASQGLLRGLRQPIVAILLLIALFTSISGKPFDGVLILAVACLLAWDAGRIRPASRSETALTAGASGPDMPLPAHKQTGHQPASPAAPRPASRSRLWLGRCGWLTAALAYVAVVGSFKRYSWPATLSVAALGCLMVAIGWQGPLRQRARLTGQALRRAWLWAVVLVAGGLWELSSLVQQPHLTTDSYAHPTISALTDPLLTTHPGRSLALGVWLLIGVFLAGR